MKSSNNILRFPKDRFQGTKFPETVEEVNDRVQELKRYHVQEAIETVVPLFFNQIQMLGFEPPEDETMYVKDGAMIVESIRSFMHKLYDMHHPLQIISEHLFEDGGEEGMIMSDHVKVVINPQNNESDS